MTDPASTIQTIAAALSIVDIITNQLRHFSGRRVNENRPHSVRAHKVGDELHIERNGRVEQKLTRAEVDQLPQSDRELIETYEKSMEDTFKEWKALYPRRETDSEIDVKLRQLAKKFCADLQHIFQFLGSMGYQLQDHYADIQYVCNDIGALPDLKFHAAADPQSIISACETEWDAFKSDCSGFVKAVAVDVGIGLSGQADDIVDQIQSNGWKILVDGIAAKAQADAGLFVVGGLKGKDLDPPEAHGHVVVVVSGPMAFGKYPSAYWGKLNGVGAKNQTLNYAFRASVRDNVIYGSRAPS